MTDAPPQPVRESLAAAVGELEQIVRLGRELEDALSPLLRAAGAPAPTPTMTIQALDHLVQQAEGLSQFLSALAAQCPGDWRLSSKSAAAGLGLAAQRRRLSDRSDPIAEGEDTSNELELF